ncbi:UNVERIFIED_CONTAM: hypothetical protein GTU68_013359 [Idotea baltica]|nr:hypothetical protein [Idotea baltica]
MNDIVLDVRNLRVEFPTRKGILTAVDDISLQIRRGEILGMVGESGAGKSMTGMAILGLLELPGRIASGTIHLSGDRIDTLDDHAMQTIRGRRIGAIFQDPLTSLNPLFKVGDQLVETIRLHSSLDKSQARERAKDLMREVGIPAIAQYANTRADQLSGGERQRVGVVRALMQDPEILLADEPTASLDPKTSEQIMGLLRDLAGELKLPVLINIHNVTEAKEYTDRIVGMRYGRIIFDDKPGMLDQAAMDEIYAGSPHADRSNDAAAATS